MLPAAPILVTVDCKNKFGKLNLRLKSPILQSVIWDHTCSSSKLFIMSSFISFIYSFIHSFLPPFIHSFIHLFITYSFIYLFILYSFFYSIIHTFINSEINPFILSFILSSSFISLFHYFIKGLHSVKVSAAPFSTRKIPPLFWLRHVHCDKY